MNIKQEINDMKRFEEILLVLFEYELGLLIQKLKLKQYLPLQHRLKTSELEKSNLKPERIRQVMERLGGSFVKLGQLLSLRPDLIPEEYCEEFKKLQDAVPEFPTSAAIEIIEHELGKGLNSIFEVFERKPIASASVGQVYKAKLRGRGWVAVKVRRPGIEKVFHTDMDILAFFAKLFVKYHHPEIIDPVEIVREFEHYTTRELNYDIELRNITKFYENFEHAKEVVCPKPFPEFSTSKVLTMGFIDGEKISQMTLSEKKKKKIISLVVHSVFKQVFEDGYFHADPHPGNVLVMDDGKIAFIDFGIMGRINPEMKESIAGLFSSLILKDIKGLADYLMELGMVPTDLNRNQLMQDLGETLSPYYDVDLKKLKFSEVFSELIAVSRRNKIKLPSSFVLLAKAIITVEGFAVELDPGFNLVTEAKPYVKSLKAKQLSLSSFFQQAKESSLKFRRMIFRLPEKSEELVNRVKDADEHIKKIDEDILLLRDEMDQSSSRVSLGLLITGCLVAGALMMELDQRKVLGVPLFSFIAFCLSGVFVLLLIRSVLKGRK